MAEDFARLKLRFNPFEPAASGVPIVGKLWVPERWASPLRQFLDEMQHTQGARAFAILGGYGSGKTYLLRWLEREELPKRRIRAFFFDNPGVQFYDLANALMRQLGREEFAKALWEFLDPRLPGFQPSLFGNSFQEWLRAVKKHRREDDAIRELSKKIQEKGIADDGEIRHKLARLIAETYEQPYFQYKDFVAGRRGALVPEKEEAPYFASIRRRGMSVFTILTLVMLGSMILFGIFGKILFWMEGRGINGGFLYWVVGVIVIVTFVIAAGTFLFLYGFIGNPAYIHGL